MEYRRSMTVGDRVLAMWPQEEEWWYPGTITGVEGDFFDVRYDDGDQARLSSTQLKPLAVGLGARVHCKWKGGDHYYPGRVTEATGEVIHVDYDEGDREDTVVAMIRVNQQDL